MATKSKVKEKVPTKTAAKPAAKPAAKVAQKAVEPVPKGTPTVIAHLICAGASDAIAFYKKAFGATELMRLDAPGGKIMHACVKIGDSPVFLVDENLDYGMCGPAALKGSAVTLHLSVPDADALAARAVKAGAKLLMPVQETFWGDRYGQIEDPFGHRWSLATHVRNMTPDEIKKAAGKMF